MYSNYLIFLDIQWGDHRIILPKSFHFVVSQYQFPVFGSPKKIKNFPKMFSEFSRKFLPSHLHPITHTPYHPSTPNQAPKPKTLNTYTTSNTFSQKFIVTAFICAFISYTFQIARFTKNVFLCCCQKFQGAPQVFYTRDVCSVL